MEEYEVILSSLANKEWLKVIDWYNDKREGLGFEVFDEIDEYLKRLKTLPYINRIVEGEIRLSTTPRFHFGIFYTVKTNTVCDRYTQSKRGLPRYFEKNIIFFFFF